MIMMTMDNCALKNADNIQFDLVYKHFTFIQSQEVERWELERCYSWNYCVCVCVFHSDQSEVL